MYDTTKQENNFIAYEYKDVTVRRDMETLYADSFPSFGWKFEGRSSSLSPSAITLKFKRNRKITNKAELSRLQREYDSHIEEIEKLENSKLIAPSAVAYTVGIVGTAFMAGSVFSFLAGLIVLCIVLAVPAFVGWVVPYFAFLRIQKSRTDKVAPLIDSRYDAIYNVCEKANSLVNC